jgi:hypothetical protein
VKLEIDDYDAATGRVRTLHAVVVGTIILIIMAITGFSLEEVFEELARVAAHTMFS